MKKLIAYKTNFQLTANIIKTFQTQLINILKVGVQFVFILMNS